MTPPPARAAARDNGRATPAQRGTQRDRLLDAMTELCARRGYPAVSVADVASHAGVSSATFYELFGDKEDCLLAAYQRAAESLLGEVPDAAAGGDWREAMRELLVQLLGAWQEHPDAGRLMLVEALAGGPRVRAERARALRGLRRRTQRIFEAAARQDVQLLLSPELAVGAIRSVAANLLRTHGEDRLMSQVDPLLVWIGCYESPLAGRDGASGGQQPLPARISQAWTRAAAALIGPPDRLPRGRHKLPAAAVVRTQRARIAFGTAKVIVEKGYAAATVTDIVAAAGISRDVFYAQFANKHEAYLAAQQFGTDELLATCAAAYFAGATWSERVWGSLRTLLVAIAANPEISHLRIVECYAAGPDAVEQTESLKRAAAIFLQEGYLQGGRAGSLPRLCSHAIIGGVFESLYEHLAGGEADAIPRELPALAHLALTPFVGAEQATSEVERLRSLTIDAVPA